MNFTLRPARKEDAPAIRALIWKVRINPLGLDWRHFIIAVDERERLIATGQIKPHRDGTFELASIATEPAWRGRGVASEVIRRLMDQAPRPLYLMTITPTAPFYLRFGFRALNSSAMPADIARLAHLAAWLRRITFSRQPALVVMAIGLNEIGVFSITALL